MGAPPEPEPTSTSLVSELLPGSGSGVDDATVAVFVSRPAAAVTRTVIVTVANDPGFKKPRAALTVPLKPIGGPEQEPWLELHERKSVAAGSGSVSVTFDAACGPALETRIT